MDDEEELRQQMAREANKHFLAALRKHHSIRKKVMNPLVLKLRRKANDPSVTPEERAAFNAKADELEKKGQ